MTISILVPSKNEAAIFSVRPRLIYLAFCPDVWLLLAQHWCIHIVLTRTWFSLKFAWQIILFTHLSNLLGFLTNSCWPPNVTHLSLGRTAPWSFGYENSIFSTQKRQWENLVENNLMAQFKLMHCFDEEPIETLKWTSLFQSR